MNISQFFEHWGIIENPFRGEEARHDAVFQRLGYTDPGSAAPRPERKIALGSQHSDFEKILGEMTRPATSIVFGEKGSGKTAMRLQIEDRVLAHNAANPDSRVFIIPYDELNPFIAEINARYSSSKDPVSPFRKIRLVDHMDAMLSVAVDLLVASLFKEGPDRPTIELGEDTVKTVRRMPMPLRLDLLQLQALYDPADVNGDRTAKMRRLLRIMPDRRELVWNGLVIGGWVPVVLALVFSQMIVGELSRDILLGLGGFLLLLYLVVIFKRLVWDRFVIKRLARRVNDEMRCLPRPEEALARSLGSLEPGQRNESTLPATADADEPRYHALAALRRVLARFGYTGMLVLIDRVDEPTLVNGDAEKMRAMMWPLFNNKFLQQERFGVKMLLPVELRHALFKESAAFFQEARLDKQSFIERLTWTGPMLYDLCNARLGVCRPASAEPISLIDIFDEEVTRNDLVEALNNMQQPRDAFKFMYRVFSEHCASVTAEDGRWRIARHTLDRVRRDEAERVMQLQRGIRPA